MVDDNADPENVPDTHENVAQTEIMKRRKIATTGLGEGSVILRGGEWFDLRGAAAAAHYIENGARTGLALSGGGIRSATISLGLIEALASRGRLYGFDLMSTVSGGGYCGSFVRSLFVERTGSVLEKEKEIVADRVALADGTLSSLPDQQYFRGDPGPSTFVKPNKAVKNPLWWLRENGRYLAPGGMSDYGYALSYIVRNWITLIVYLLAALMIGFALLQLGLVGIVTLATAGNADLSATFFEHLKSLGLYSPLIPVLGLMMIVGTGTGAAYWLTIPLPFSQLDEGQSSGERLLVALAVAILLALLAVIAWLATHNQLPTDHTATAWAGGVFLTIVAGLLTTVLALVRRTSATYGDFRREQTRLLTQYNGFVLVIAAMTLIDCLALSLRRAMDEGSLDIFSSGAITGAVASITSFLVAKLPDWIGGEGSQLAKFLVKQARYGALIAGVAILSAIALLADLLVIKLLWRGAAWDWQTSIIDWRTFLFVMGVISIFTLLFSCSRNFINLLALTPFYGSRLTRAYIGGSNILRLQAGARGEVTHGLEGDDLDLKAYMTAPSPAPLHLINVTRNRTVGDRTVSSAINVAKDDPLVREEMDDPRGRLPSFESQLTLYDRHGDRMVFGPFGMRVGGEFFGWDDLDNVPSLGLLCGISGAAVGSGMGRHTSLGSAMAFTLANVRLGYWWNAQVHKSAGEKPAAVTLLPGATCLYNELIGKFGTRNHWFLSDGGHSENSGALTLLERGCKLLLVSDNAQDSDYSFSDLEIFIRAARTDIGMEVLVAGADDFPESLRSSRELFFNGADGDWRARAKEQGDQAFALLLRAADIPFRVNGTWRRRRRGHTWIIWLKPNRFTGLTSDVATYAELNTDFPQQSTGNQFFDEAQWESYRRIGFQMGRSLFTKRETLAEFLPIFYRT